MLLRPDGTRYADTGDAPTRRTVVGQDTEGRILLLIVSRETFTLAALAEWLMTTNLGLTLALNLDGGGSTGYYAGPNDMTASQVRLPAVVAVYPP
jgi:exopolysaccharide biosynthesis protein